MNFLTKRYLEAGELRHKWSKGQTMAEYAIVTAAVAAVVFAVYQVTGGDIATMVGKVNADLSAS
jgi:Flp pilus assembly pilin Flp